MNSKTVLNFKMLSRDELLSETCRQVATERDATLTLIECLREIDSRKLFLEMGFSSLHEFTIQYLGLSEGAAHRRISAARLISQIPEVRPALESGKLNLTTVVLAQSAFRRKRYSVTEKKEILHELECHSKKEVEQTLSALCPENAKPDQVRVLSGSHSELKLSVSHEMIKKLDRLRELLAHTHAQASYSELLEYGLDLALKKLDPQGKPTTDTNQRGPSPPPAKATGNVRYIPSHLKLLIWKRAHGRCEFVGKETKKRCSSRFALQYDHIHPIALGGQTTESNLRLLCASHNSFEAARVLGAELMDRYRSESQRSIERVPAP